MPARSDAPSPTTSGRPAFSRRRLLTTGAAGLGAAAMGLPAPSSAIPPMVGQSPQITNSGVYQFRIGTLEAAVISVAQRWNPNGLDLVLTDDKSAVEQILEAGCERPDGLASDMNVLLLRRGPRVLLVDSGLPGPAVPVALALLGISPEQVTDVILTHAHGDHFGGLRNEAGQRVFPDAQVHILQPELDFWLGEAPDFSRSPRSPDEITQAIAGAKSALQNLQKEGVLQPHPPGTTLWDGAITLRQAAGHTPGHTIVEIQDGDERLVHIVDLAHHFLLQFARPDWSMAYDTDPQQAATTRGTHFAELAAARTRTLGYHLPFPGLGHIQLREPSVPESTAPTFRWLPERWLTTGWKPE